MPDVRPAELEGRGLVVLLHGAWVSAAVWGPWVRLLDRHGYDAVTPFWPREGMPGGRHSLRELAAAAADVVDAQERAPVVLGHGIGGLIGHTLVTRCRPSAVIALAPAPTGLRALTSRPLLRPGPPAELVSAIDPERVTGLWVRRPDLFLGPRGTGRTATPVPGTRPPVLLVSGGRDRMAPEPGVEALERRNRRRHPDDVSDHQVFPDRGHALAHDAGWRDVAWFCLDWLTRQNL